MQSIFDNAAMAAALRRRQPISSSGAAMGGGGVVGRQPSFGGGISQPTVQRQQDPQMLSQGASDKLMEMLKGSMASSGTTGANIGQAAQIYGPEVAKMGGTVTAPTSGAGGGTGFMSSLTNLFGGGGGAGGGAGAGAGGAGAGSGAGGAMASMGPWAALAAAIGLNEEHSRKKGFRDEDRGKRLQDQLTGKVLTQDLEGKWGPMMDKWTGGRMSKWGLTGDMKAASQLGSFRFGKGLKTFTKEGTPGKIVDALKKLF